MLDMTAPEGAAGAAETGWCDELCEVSLVHHLPGRLRLRSTAAKGNAPVSEELRRGYRG